MNIETKEKENKRQQHISHLDRWYRQKYQYYSFLNEEGFLEYLQKKKTELKSRYVKVPKYLTHLNKMILDYEEIILKLILEEKSEVRLTGRKLKKIYAGIAKDKEDNYFFYYRYKNHIVLRYPIRHIQTTIYTYFIK